MQAFLIIGLELQILDAVEVLIRFRVIGRLLRNIVKIISLIYQERAASPKYCGLSGI